MAEKKTDNKDSEILRVARERYKHAKDAWAEIHAEARIDDEFSAGIQWPEQVKKDRASEGRPCLTVNRLPQFIRQVVNDQKQNNPSATFIPQDDEADVETAKIYQGLNRHIEQNSRADLARDWAFDGAARRGFGWWRIITDYVSPTSFNQEIRYQKILDAYSVLIDPNSTEVDGSDMNYGFVHRRMQKDEFCAEYGKSKLAQDDNWDIQGTALPDHVSEDSCLVIEYYYKDFNREAIYLLSTGQSLTKKAFEDQFNKGLLPDDFQIVDERETVTAVVKWIKFAGDEILENTEWASQWIPLVPCFGEQLVVNGKLVYEGVIRHARDSQRMLNYWVSAETETIALAPKAPFIGAAGQFDSFEDKWSTANTKSHPYLEYNPVDVNGSPVSAPSRNFAEPPVQAITNARVQAQEDLKATTGIYDAALGARSNENSGIAIQRRANQAQTSNFHFMANFEASVKHSGRIVAELIPVVYDAPRTETILGEDGEAERVRLNEEFVKNGEARKYDLSKGKYDLAVDMGPSFATRRQEAQASMLEVVKMNPSLFGIMGDLFMKNMDWSGAQEMAERFKKTMDPKLLDDGKQQIPPMAQAQIAQMGQAIQQLQMALQDANQKLQTKALEIQSKEKIETAKLETEILLEKMKLAQTSAQFQIETQLAELQMAQGLPLRPAYPNQSFNGSGPEMAANPNQSQPTGGQPGPYME